MRELLLLGLLVLIVAVWPHPVHTSFESPPPRPTPTGWPAAPFPGQTLVAQSRAAGRTVYLPVMLRW